MARLLALGTIAGIWLATAAAGPLQKQPAPGRAAQPAARAARIPPLKPQDINLRTNEELGPESKGAAVIRAQILLDRVRFSPGEIELSFHGNLESALRAYQTARGLQPTGIVDAPTWAALEEEATGPERELPPAGQDRTQGLDEPRPLEPADAAGAASASGAAPVLIEYTITREDAAGPFTRMPRARSGEELMLKKAGLPQLNHASALEKLAEKFHINPKLLAQLNPRKNFGRAGVTILVPDIAPPQSVPANLVVVDASDRGVTALSAEGLTLAFYPATMGSEHDPLPLGNWKVNGVERLPKFHYNARLFWDAKNKDARAVLPPGPNSPVGTVWIDLSKEHYGIHGTPEPGLIGKTESHGCIRLTNWDAEELAGLVKPGTAVILQE